MKMRLAKKIGHTVPYIPSKNYWQRKALAYCLGFIYDHRITNALVLLNKKRRHEKK